MQAPKDYWHQRFAHATLHSAALTSLLSGPQLYSTQTAHCHLPSPHTLTGSGLVNGHPSRQQQVVKAWGQPWLLNLPSSDFNLKMTRGVALWASRCLVLVLTEQERAEGILTCWPFCSFSWYCFPWFKSKLEMTPSPQSLTSLRNVCV